MKSFTKMEINTYQALLKMVKNLVFGQNGIKKVKKYLREIIKMEKDMDFGKGGIVMD